MDLGARNTALPQNTAPVLLRLNENINKAGLSLELEGKNVPLTSSCFQRVPTFFGLHLHHCNSCFCSPFFFCGVCVCVFLWNCSLLPSDKSAWHVKFKSRLKIPEESAHFKQALHLIRFWHDSQIQEFRCVNVSALLVHQNYWLNISIVQDSIWSTFSLKDNIL